ncbi:NAD(P)-binding protein [Aulographum hederae CBS 113979]|uniref:NAD(P)-binding protein n=1 Tax=Aulographum hederae CBS 113979 TaxID=1176131 RepID=A0A6G1H0X5_9PEZI|nr:NAD(P)-binding protein [Aulographum hederae CBS 113979]
MSNEIKNVIVIGAGGNTGPAIVSELVNSGFNVSALARESSNSPVPAGIPVHRTDYSRASLLAAFKGQDAIVSAINTFRVAQQLAVVDAAVECGVKRFIPSEYGLDSALAAAPEEIPPLKQKQETISLLRTKQDQGMSWTAVCVGGYFDWAIEVGLFGWDVRNRVATIYENPDRPYAASNLGRIAEAIRAVLQKPAETANKYVYVQSFSTTQHEVLAALEKATGDKFTIKHARTEEARELGRKALAEGDELTGLGAYVTAAIYGGSGMCDFEEKIDKWAKILELKPENLQETIDRVVAKVGGGGKKGE